MHKTILGRINGRTIQLSEDLGISAGQEVEVQVTVCKPNSSWGEGVRRCAGALSDDEEWDNIMEEVHQQRQVERRLIPESE